MTADKMLRELGYKKIKYNQGHVKLTMPCYKNVDNDYIYFWGPTNIAIPKKFITMQELKAINEKVLELRVGGK